MCNPTMLCFYSLELHKRLNVVGMLCCSGGCGQCTMGYDVTRFQGEVDEDLLCPICSGVLEEPVQASISCRFSLLLAE